MIGINNYSLSQYGYNGVGSIGGMDSMAALNNAKLYEALTGKSSGINTGRPTTSASQGAAARKFVSEYQDQMSGMMDAANTVKSAVQNSVAASSTDDSIVSASLRYKTAASGDFDVNVQQIATKQVNVSNAVAGGAANSMTGSLEIRTNGNENPITVDMGSFQSARTNREALEAAAKEINGQKAGVTAQVVEKEDGAVSLQIASEQTGEKSAFLVSGSFAENNGMTQAVQQAQNSVYSVNGGEEQVSSGNTISLDGYKVEATFKKAGNATISVGQNPAGAADAMQNMVDKYNGALKFLNDNADMGSGVIREMKNMLTMSISDESMAKIGVTSNKDGTLSFDRSTFTSAAKKNPSLTASLAGGNYSLASGIYNDARSGMSISSRSLVDGAQRSQSSNINSWLNSGNRFSSTTYGNYFNYASSLSLLNMLV